MFSTYINEHAFLTIIFMGMVTYLTRIGGYLVFSKYDHPRLKNILEIIPGCVMISLIAPYFVTGRIADMIALIFTVTAAIRYSFLVTLIIAIGSAGLLRYLLG